MALRTDFTPAETLALLGAVLTVVAAFLPWVTAGVQAGPVDVSTTATGIVGLGVLTALLALVAAGAVLGLDRTERNAVGTAAVGAVVLLVALWKILDLGGVAAPGIGLYLTAVGGGGVLVAGGWRYRSDSERSNEGPVG